MTTKPPVSEPATKTPAPAQNFIRNMIDEDGRTGKHGNGRVATRFPPGAQRLSAHRARRKSICLNFGLARDYKGSCNLRYDDTNPVKEDVEFVKAIEEDVHWLGFEWTGKHFASDYFEKLYDYAVALIKLEKAYVDELSAEQIREYRGARSRPPARQGQARIATTARLPRASTCSPA